MSLEWVPEYYSRSGGLAAAGFYKLLGRPRLDPLAVLVRETAQNSWDARDHRGGPVLFGLEGWELTSSEVEALRSKVLPDAHRVAGVEIDSVLSEDVVHGLYVTDRGTKGLGGPVHADDADPQGICDWVDFVLNVGKANTQGQSGGTYGFGKTISYIVSRINTIIIHSRTLHKNKIQTRLMACAIGDEFQYKRKNCTGRHWWGRSADGAPAPLTGAAADRLAERIGMPAFNEGATGTNLLILSPDFGGRKPKQAMTFMAECVAWHLWPKLLDTGDGLPMEISVSWNGKVVDVPAPDDRPPLDLFARAYRALRTGNPDEALGERLHPIRCKRPKTEVGLLATVGAARRSRVLPDDGHQPEEPDSPPRAASIAGASHHVALLRAPDLVVDYLEGPPLPESQMEWAGVFRCHDEHDSRFARAEPPTHDAWSAELLPKGPDKTIVNVGMREVVATINSLWSTPSAGPGGSVMSAAAVANQLAHLVGTVLGKGPGEEQPPPPPPPPPSARGPRIAFGGSQVGEEDSGVFTVASFDLTHARGSVGSRVAVSVGVALDGSQSDPDLDPRLELVEASWEGGSVVLNGLAAEFEVEGSGSTRIEIRVRRSPSTAVLFDTTAEATGL